MSKNILIVAHDTEVADCLKNALSFVASVQATQFAIAATKILTRSPQAVLLLYTSSNDSLRDWLWGKIREKKFKNPVLVIGYANKDDFIAEHPIFDKKFKYDGSHCYFPIPFKLDELRAALFNLQCLESSDLTVILNFFATDKKYIRMILHDVNGTAKPSCDEVRSRFGIARRYFEKINDSSLLKRIDDYLAEVPQLSRRFDWKKESCALARDIRDL